jgi:hypothetical protein
VSVLLQTPPHTSMAIDWNKIDNPDVVLQRFPSRRSVVYGTKGMVACSQPLAAEAGLEILRRGGNACDAAVATSAALNVTEPSCCGIGGYEMVAHLEIVLSKFKATLSVYSMMPKRKLSRLLMALADLLSSSRFELPGRKESKATRSLSTISTRLLCPVSVSCSRAKQS